MGRPQRVKTYSAQTGVVYQYVFAGERRSRRRWFRSGTEYLFDVSADRRSNFRVVIFVARGAVSGWAKEHGRALSSPEQYAAAKLRLLAAFDEIENLQEQALGLEVSAGQLEQLLAGLDAV